MTLAPVLNAAPAIQIHVVAVVAACVLTVLQLVGKKGVTLHRVLGYSWAVSMIAAAISSFWIHSIRLIGPFSPIHILSIITIVGVPSAIHAARQHNVRAHKLGIAQLVGFALLGAGAFALFSPGRIMYDVLFGM